jgi:DNA adenine methylase
MNMITKTRNKAPVSPLRYPGAKRWMSGYISRSIAQNNLLPELFVEPFAGGASVALAQLHSGLVDKVALNDRDPLVSAFWQTVFFDTDWLVDQVWQTEITLSNWERLRRQNPTTTRGQAFKCLYLNRTNFSGVLAPNAGPIGGKSQKSQYKIDCRFTKETVIRRIQKVARYKKRVAFVWNLSWKAALGRIQRMQRVGSLPKTSLFYLDPPFYKKASSLYAFHFDHAAHVVLRDFLTMFDEPWILSYDSCPEIIALYKGGGFCASNVNLIYTASQKSERGIGKELIVSNLSSMVSELQLGVGKNAANPARIAELAKRNHEPSPAIKVMGRCAN